MASLDNVRPLRPNSVISIGDSITIANSENKSHGLKKGSRDPLAWAALLSDGRIRPSRNAGISGDSMVNMARRIYDDVIRYRPAACVVMGGTNDYSYGTTFQQYTDAVAKIAGDLTASGIIPVFCTITPRPAGTPQKTWMEKLNLFLSSFCKAHGLPLVDAWGAMVDPATGEALTGYLADGLHPSTTGAKAIGQVISDALAPLLPSWSAPLATHDGVATNNLLLTPTFQTDTNVDGVANNWINSVVPSMTPSLVTDVTIKGKWQKINAPAPALGSSSSAYQVLTAGWSVGDRIAMCARATISLGAGLGNDYCYSGVMFIGPNSIWYPIMDPASAGGVNEPASGVLGYRGAAE